MVCFLRGVSTSPPYCSTQQALTPSLKLPFWVLVSFGALLLGRLGWGVLTFNDTPEAHKELLVEIEEAKKDLRRLGVTVD